MCGSGTGSGEGGGSGGSGGGSGGSGGGGDKFSVGSGSVSEQARQAKDKFNDNKSGIEGTKFSYSTSNNRFDMKITEVSQNGIKYEGTRTNIKEGSKFEGRVRDVSGTVDYRDIVLGNGPGAPIKDKYIK